MMFFIMAQIGGLYSFLKMVFGTIINAIQHKMMLIEIINRYNHRRVEDSVKRRKTKQLEKALQHHNRLINPENVPEDSKINDGGEEQYYSSPQSPPNNEVLRNIEESMSRLDVKQNLYKYNYADLFYQFICCFKTKPNNGSTLEDSLDSRHNQFMRDLENFNKEIDAINLISTIKNLKHTANDIYTEIERLKGLEIDEPQTIKNLSSGITREMKKLQTSQLESAIKKPSQINEIAKNSIENVVKEKPEESFKIDNSADIKNVSLSLM